MIAAAISAFVVIVDGEQVFATREQQAPLRLFPFAKHRHRFLQILLERTGF